MIAITEDKLIEYILGLCDESENRAIEARLQTSNELQERMARLHDTLALPALDSEPIDPSEGLSARILKSIDKASPFEGFIHRLTVFLDLPEKRVRELLGRIETAEQDWEKSGLPGVSQHGFQGGPRHSDSECALIRMQPRAIFPPHSHLGDEWGFILQGEAKEDSGRIAKPGDMVYQATASKHTFTAIGDTLLVFFVVHNGISFD